MAERLLKCYGDCEGKYPKEQLVKFGGQNHCISCATKKEKDGTDRDALYKTIQTVYKIPFPNGQMLRQIKMFKEERNYTYEGMTKTLCYFIKVQKKEPFLNGGLSFLPYHYDNAIKYYNDLEERRRNITDIDNKAKVLIIKQKKQSKQDELKNKRFINMGGLLFDE